MKTNGGVEVQLHTFLMSALGESEWSASHHGERTLLYPLDRRLGGLQSQYEHGGEDKKSLPCQESNSGLKPTA
jgi:hypothetical protein